MNDLSPLAPTARDVCPHRGIPLAVLALVAAVTWAP
jgi:hypothetical protein